MKAVKISIIVIGVLVIASAVVLVILRFSSSNNNANNANVPANTNQATNTNLNNSLPINNTAGNQNKNQNTNQIPTNTNVTPTDPEASLRAVARSFTERFGTYSNHSDFENIEHLIPYMTGRMKKWAEKFLADQRAKQNYSEIYYGTTTRALSVKTVSYDESSGTAEFLVSTQRKESTGTTSNARIYYQDIQIKFKKEQAVWKVDEAWWQ